MSVLLLNDTSSYHCGCKEVVKYIVQKYNCTSTIITGGIVSNIPWKNYSLVVLNGEGTLHHDRPNAVKFLTALRDAQRAGCRTIIVNTVWQDMPHDFDDVLQRCESVTVRETYSQQEITKHSITASVSPDLSYFNQVPVQEFAHVTVYEGQYFFKGRDETGGYPRLDIFKQSWHELVNRLRNADLLITGRHHGMYAACVAKCKFITKPGNTWKNEGLLASAGVVIPFDIDGVLAGKYNSEYERLWRYLDDKRLESKRD